jgi:hypothetical protein
VCASWLLTGPILNDGGLSSTAFLERQARLSAIERLYLALFVDRENDSMAGGSM